MEEGGRGWRALDPLHESVPRGSGCCPWGCGQALTSFKRSMSLR